MKGVEFKETFESHDLDYKIRIRQSQKNSPY